MAFERLDILNQLNNCNNKANIKVFDMVLYELYNIQSAKLCSSKLGLRVVLELNNYQLFLPTRFSTLSIEALREINKGGFKVTNIGPVGKTFNIIFTMDALIYHSFNDELYFQPNYYNPASEEEEEDVLETATASDI